MKKSILLLGIILIFAQSVSALELQGGVSFDENSARTYVQEGQVNDIGPQDYLYFNGDSSNADIIYGYDRNNIPNGFAVRYKNDLKTSYEYGMDNKLTSVDKYDKPSNIFPHRGYEYDANGKLLRTSLMTSKNNGFTFTPNGKLIVHLTDGIGYLGRTNIIVCRQSNY